MPDDGTFVVSGGAIGVEGRHAREGTVAVVFKVGIAHHRAEFVDIALGSGGTTVGGFGCEFLAEGGTPLVYPHVGICGTGEEVAKPGVPQLVA